MHAQDLQFIYTGVEPDKDLARIARNNIRDHQSLLDKSSSMFNCSELTHIANNRKDNCAFL